MNAKLECTTDYDLFESHSYNRELRDLSLLKSSMNEHGFRPSSPIHVVRNGSNKLKIKRGHHRFAAAKELGLPVWYIVDDDTMSIYEWEFDSRQTWTLRDFVASYANAGNEDYKKALEYSTNNNIPLLTALSLVGGECASSWNSDKQRLARSGRFKAKETNHAREMSDLITFLRQQEFPFISMRFLSALSMALFVPEFDKQIFKSRVSQYPKLMKRRATANEFLEEIENVYNYNAKTNRLDLKARVLELKKIATRGQMASQSSSI